jgi:hypothetical protein
MWAPPSEDCVSHTIQSTSDYISKSPDSTPPTNGTVIYLPKKLTVSISGTKCKGADGDYNFIWSNNSSPLNGAPGYILNGSYSNICTQNRLGVPLGYPDASINIGGSGNFGSVPGKLFYVRISFDKIVIRANISIPIRYRREYGDWTFAEKAIGNSQVNIQDTDGRVYFYHGPYSDSPSDRLYGNGCFEDNCTPAPIFSDNVSVTVASTEATCRVPVPPTNCTDCVATSSVDYNTLPSYSNYISGCTGRPIDIDYDVCTNQTRPESFNKSNIALYYQGGSGQPFLVIDNIAYDPRNAGLIKVFTAGSPSEMRNLVCNRLRFASLVDENLLNSDINAALNSDWPYNDLYWYSSCANFPDEVPINLVPC